MDLYTHNSIQYLQLYILILPIEQERIIIFLGINHFPRGLLYPKVLPLYLDLLYSTVL